VPADAAALVYLQASLMSSSGEVTPPGAGDLPGIPAPGDWVAGGKYQIERLIGLGGMGVVMSAIHVQLDERVAMKFLLPAALQNAGAVDRFLREARALVSLKNEHVVRVLDVDKLPSGSPYIVMEHLVGADLGEILALCGPLPVSEAIDYVLQACAGVAEAHARGIVHRDLKPANLFVTERPDGTPLVKVLDFGISKALQAEAAPRADLTSTRAVMGSPLYMSPEQVRGSKNVDTRADIWALGVVLYELVSGQPPFDAPSVLAVCARICADPPVPLRAHRADAPEGLEKVVLRCLEKDPALRCSNVAELARALGPLAAEESQPIVEWIVRRLEPAPQFPDRPSHRRLAPRVGSAAEVRVVESARRLLPQGQETTMAVPATPSHAADEHVEELLAVPHDGQGGSEVHHELDRPGERAPKELCDLVTDVRQHHGRQTGAPLSREPEEATRHLLASREAGTGVVQTFLDFWIVETTVARQHRQVVHARLDEGEDVPEVVGEACRQTTECLHPLALPGLVHGPVGAREVKDCAAADINVIAVLQRRPLNRDAVHAGAVSAPEVFQHEESAGSVDAGVGPGHLGIVDEDVGLRRAPDDQLGLDRVPPSHEVSLDHHQSRGRGIP
jgi:serine/threonine-protein kinase